MTHRTLTIALFMLLSVATGFAQSTYMGMTPGRSTRADAERVLLPGPLRVWVKLRSVTNASATFAEDNHRWNADVVGRGEVIVTQ